MSTSRFRAGLGVLVAALLLSACATAPDAPAAEPETEASTTPDVTAEPDPITTKAGQSRIPAGCDDVLGSARDEQDFALWEGSGDRNWGAWWVSRLQSGLALCDFESAAGDRLLLAISLYSDPDFLGEWQAAEEREIEGVRFRTSCPELEPGVPYYCGFRAIAGPYFVETVMFSSEGRDASIIGRYEAVVPSVIGAASSLPAPLPAAVDLPSGRAWPADCAGLALASSPSASTFPVLAGSPYPGFIAPEDLSVSLLYATPDVEVLACDWSPVQGSEFPEVRVEVLKGGSWALDEAAALPGGRAVTITGTDRARILEHPRLRGAVVAGSVGPDLVLAHVFESAVAPTPEEREAAAIALLADLVGSVPDAS